MQRRTTRRRLFLHRETLRILDSRELVAARGGLNVPSDIAVQSRWIDDDTDPRSTAWTTDVPVASC